LQEYTIVGKDSDRSQIVLLAVVETVAINTTLEIIAASTLELSLTILMYDNAGGDFAASAHLVIKQL
jgi:hypothetical protein